MRELLSAGFAALRKNKALWACALGVFVISLCIVLNGARKASPDYTLDHYFFNFLPMIGLFWAAFGGLYVGAEYDHGLLRNKLAVGHTRADVYLSNLVVSTAAALLMLAAWFMGGLAGIPLLGPWSMPWPQLICTLGLCVLTAVSFCAILVAVEMSVPNRAISTVVSMGLALGLILCASMLYNALGEPEILEEYALINGAVQSISSRPNPSFLSGAARTLVWVLVNLLPTGQQILIADNDWDMVQNLPLMIAGSLGIALLATAGGLMAFRKQNIK